MMSALHWLAGLLEGEATFHLAKTGAYTRPKIALQMTDRDVVLKAYEIAEVGNFNGPYQPTGNRKLVWTWNIGGRLDCLEFAERIYPLMGERRKGQLDILIGWCTEDD